MDVNSTDFSFLVYSLREGLNPYNLGVVLFFTVYCLHKRWPFPYMQIFAVVFYISLLLNRFWIDLAIYGNIREVPHFLVYADWAGFFMAIAALVGGVLYFHDWFLLKSESVTAHLKDRWLSAKHIRRDTKKWVGLLIVFGLGLVYGWLAAYVESFYSGHYYLEEVTRYLRGSELLVEAIRMNFIYGIASHVVLLIFIVLVAGFLSSGPYRKLLDRHLALERIMIAGLLCGYGTSFLNILIWMIR